MPYFTIKDDLLSGKINCEELVNVFLKNIKNSEHTNAYIEVYSNEALSKARLVDKKIKQGKAGKFAGLIISVKDLIAHENHAVSGGSHILSNYTSPFSASVLQQLLNEDAIVIGRVNCDEFGMGSSNENSAFGPVKNFEFPDRVPGGSSGGSAVAVQADTCHISLGTDTGGSVRQPASFCGIYGLKPTYSALSRYGLLAYASSFDTMGIFASSIHDLENVFVEVANHDDKDSTSSTKNKEFNNTSSPFKIGYYKQAIEHPGLDPDIKLKFLETIELLKKEGNVVEALEFPLLEYLLPTYYILTTAEASSNLSRYDGMRYGFRSDNNSDLLSTYKNTRTQGFGKEVKRRIFLGTFVLSASYFDAFYTKAQKARNLIRTQTKENFSSFDILLGPTTPTPAFKLGEKTADPLSMYLADIYTVHASVGGFPAINMPWYKQIESGLPVGIQAMADDFCENKLFSFAKYLQSLSK